MSNFSASLIIMVYGMGGIFAVILIIILILKLMILLFPVKRKTEEETYHDSSRD